MRKSNVCKFKNLPEIPKAKEWRDGYKTTLEQEIMMKFTSSQEVSQEEKKILYSLKDFYHNLSNELRRFNYEELKENEIDEFKNYIEYALNYTPIITNSLSIIQTFRLVVNEWVSGKNESIENISFLKYPSLDIIKKSNKYGRANSPCSNVLYTTQNIDTALLEIKPPLNKKVTVAIWQPNKDKRFISYPISHSYPAIENESVLAATQAFDKSISSENKIFLDTIKNYFEMLGYEYTKDVKHHYEYILSSYFSERILEGKSIDLILYPSVGNEFKTENFAIRPEVVDRDFTITNIIEFEVEEACYDCTSSYNHNPLEITIAKIKNVKSTKEYTSDGTILW